MRITHLFVPAIAATLILSACGGSPPPPPSPTGPTQAEIDARNDSIAAARAAEEADEAKSTQEAAEAADTAAGVSPGLSNGDPKAPTESPPGGGYVDLSAVLLGEDVHTEEKSTRFVVPYEEPTGDDQADFDRMLAQFRDKVSENIDANDVMAHYDLGTAYNGDGPPGRGDQ